MITNKPFSTISYNSIGFLTNKLDLFVDDGYIVFYALYPHKGEDDESGKKDHIHVYIEPNKRIDTQALFTELEEVDIPLNEFLELAPQEQKLHILKCMPCRTSSGKFAHWYMYSQHNPQYLKAKNLTKKFFYNAEDCITNDNDYLHYLVQQIEPIPLTPYQAIREAIENGETFHEFIAKGQIPITLIHAYSKAYDLMLKSIYDERRAKGQTYNPYDAQNYIFKEFKSTFIEE